MIVPFRRSNRSTSRVFWSCRTDRHRGFFRSQRKTCSSRPFSSFLSPKRFPCFQNYYGLSQESNANELICFRFPNKPASLSWQDKHFHSIYLSLNSNRCQPSCSFNINIQNPMGVTICNSYIQNSEVGEFQPIMSTFNPISTSIQIQPQHRMLFDKIKSKFDVVDCRKKPDLNWYQSPKYNLYLYGNVSRDRPIGDCFFYIKDTTIASTPIIITTSVNDHYVYSQNTLIVYPDSVIYYGSIRNNIATLPRAEGEGLLLSPEFVYRGEFKNGYPHGYGSYRSKNLEYVGVFKNGEPFGECIEKSSNKLFIGSIEENGSKRGVVINKHNQKTIVDEKEPLHQSKLSLRSYIKE